MPNLPPVTPERTVWGAWSSHLCQRLPREQRDRVERLDELHGLLHQSCISAKNVARVQTLTRHDDRGVAELAALILEIARVTPGKRKRWLKLAAHHRPVLGQAVELLGVEYIEDLLSGYGIVGAPLRPIVETHRSTPPWTARPCDCGSGLPFRECCLERENEVADELCLASRLDRDGIEL